MKIRLPFTHSLTHSASIIAEPKQYRCIQRFARVRLHFHVNSYLSINSLNSVGVSVLRAMRHDEVIRFTRTQHSTSTSNTMTTHFIREYNLFVSGVRCHCLLGACNTIVFLISKVIFVYRFNPMNATARFVLF